MKQSLTQLIATTNAKVTKVPAGSLQPWCPPGARRSLLLGQRGSVIWMTGLSGSGKSTLARGVEDELLKQGRLAYVLDGDVIRNGLCADLGFGPVDRTENIRRVGEVAALFADAGVMVIVAFISPFRADRDQVRALVGERSSFIEVHVAADLSVCEQRDTKGLYARARAGEIEDFTGVSAPYEEPESPEVRVDTGTLTLDRSVRCVMAYLTKE